MTIKGSCLCGKVRFCAEKIEKDYHACHCGMCRRWSGGPLMAVAAQGVQFEDEAHVERYDSSSWAQRGFCGHCGTNLFYYLKPKKMYVLCAGALEDQSELKLTGEIFIDHQPPGYTFSGNLERMTQAEFLAKYMS